MMKIYLALPLAPDKLLGYVREDGGVYRSRLGLDERVGKVELSSGKIYEDRFGPDKGIGRVDLENGKIYLSRLGPDQYVGRVDGDGRMYRHIPMGKDEYIGKVDGFISYAHSAGAMLLLVLPELEEDASSEESASSQDALPN